jgi:hypothetical protein
MKTLYTTTASLLLPYLLNQRARCNHRHVVTHCCLVIAHSLLDATYMRAFWELNCYTSYNWSSVETVKMKQSDRSFTQWWVIYIKGIVFCFFPTWLTFKHVSVTLTKALIPIPVANLLFSVCGEMKREQERILIDSRFFSHHLSFFSCHEWADLVSPCHDHYFPHPLFPIHYSHSSHHLMWLTYAVEEMS